MIANQLSKNQRFEEAMQWYHFIFNPLGLEGTLPDGTIAGAPQKYWITKPFFLTTDDEYLKQRIDSILRMLAGDTTVPGFTAQLKKTWKTRCEIGATIPSSRTASLNIGPLPIRKRR